MVGPISIRGPASTGGMELASQRSIVRSTLIHIYLPQASSANRRESKMASPKCVNLRARFGKQYKVEFEESYFAERGENARVEDLSLMMIPCQRGHHIFPWDESTLAVSLDRAPKTARKLLELGCKMAQDGDDGATLIFPVERFDEVARIVKPRRRRRLSAEQREKNAERLAKYAFTAAR